MAAIPTSRGHSTVSGDLGPLVASWRRSLAARRRSPATLPEAPRPCSGRPDSADCSTPVGATSDRRDGATRRSSARTCSAMPTPTRCSRVPSTLRASACLKLRASVSAHDADDPGMSSVQVALPVSGHPAGRPGHGLVDGMVVRWSQSRTVDEILRRVVPEPVLARLVTADHGMPGVGRMVARVLRGRRIAAADVAASGAPAQMEPPATGGEALDAARSARRDRRIDVRFAGHRPLLRRLGDRPDRSNVGPAVLHPAPGFDVHLVVLEARPDRSGRLRLGRGPVASSVLSSPPSSRARRSLPRRRRSTPSERRRSATRRLRRGSPRR
jgi:hypothetical protein